MTEPMTGQRQTPAEEEGVSAEEFADVMQQRATMYRFLSHALLKEFSQDEIDHMKQMGTPDCESEEERKGFATIHRFLSMSADPDLRTTLACEYARVFLSAGVYDGLTAEPYESVFTSEEQILMQDARDEVVAIYRANGVDVDPELHMPEDHLGLEFEFLAIMSDRCADIARKQGLDASELEQAIKTQATFIEDHILNWIDQLMEKVDEFAELPLYPAVMHIARGYTSDDKEFLQEMVKTAA